MNDEHRDAVFKVLTIRGKIAKTERTKNMVAGALAKGRARQEAIDELERQIEGLHLQMTSARMEYNVFIDSRFDEAVAFWKRQDLFDGEE